MNKSPNGTSSSKKVSYGWFGKRLHVSLWTIFWFFFLLLLCISTNLCHKCSELQQNTLVPLDTLARFPSALHVLLPKADGPPSQPTTGVQTSLWGKNQVLSICHSVQALLALLTRLSLRRPRLVDWSVLWVIQSQTLEEKPVSKTSVLIQQNKVFQEFHIGHFKKQTLKSSLTK